MVYSCSKRAGGCDLALPAKVDLGQHFKTRIAQTTKGECPDKLSVSDKAGKSWSKAEKSIEFAPSDKFIAVVVGFLVPEEDYDSSKKKLRETKGKGQVMEPIPYPPNCYIVATIVGHSRTDFHYLHSKDGATGLCTATSFKGSSSLRIAFFPE